MVSTSLRRLIIVFVVLVPFSLCVTGCRRRQTTESEEQVSLVLGMDEYYSDPEYSQFTGPASGRDRVMATVNDEAIRREQLDERLVGIVDLRKADGLPLDPETMDKVRAALLDSLITLTVERQEALRKNLEISPEDVDEVMKRFQEEQGGEEKLNEVLKNAGIKPEEFRRHFEQEVRVLKLRESVLEQPVEDPSQEEIWDYYRGDILRWVRVRASNIFIAAPSSLSLLERQKRKELAERVRNRAMQGEDFAELAGEFSNDEKTREVGGDMGWAPMNLVAPPVRGALADLAVGAVSDLVETNDPSGYSIFKVTDVQRKTPDDEDVRKIITEKWKNRRREELYKEWLVRRRNESRVVILDTKIRETLGL
jgi:foldase protein PrsA